MFLWGRRAQQSGRRYAANGFASVPRTMPPLLNKEGEIGIVWGLSNRQ